MSANGKENQVEERGQRRSWLQVRNLRSISVMDQEAFLLHLSHFVKEVKPDTCS